MYLRDTAHLVSIELQLQFYVTPIIYQITQVPEDWHGIPLRAIVEYSPSAVFVELFRALVYELTGRPGVVWPWRPAGRPLAVGGRPRVYRRRGLDLSEEL